MTVRRRVGVLRDGGSLYIICLVSLPVCAGIVLVAAIVTAA